MPYFDHYFSHIPGPVRSAVEALEAELDRPIRVCYGRGRTWSLGTEWTDEQAYAVGLTVEQASATGVAVVLWGTPHARHLEHPYETRAVPASVNDGLPRFYDCLNPADATLAEPVEIDGVLWAEIADRQVYLLSSISNLDYFAAGNLNFETGFAALVRDCVDSERMAGLQARLAAAQQDALVKFVQRASMEGVTAVRGQIAEWEHQLALSIERAANAKHQLRDKQRLLDAMLAGLADHGEDRITRSWAALLADPRVESARFDQGSDHIIIDTIELDLTHPTDGRTVTLGKFRWNINPITAAISVHNLTNARGGYDHPHINNHVPCFGEMGTTIHTLVKQGDLHAAVEMIFLFLDSINLDDDWGRRAAFWFDADDEARLGRAEPAVVA